MIQIQINLKIGTRLLNNNTYLQLEPPPIQHHHLLHPPVLTSFLPDD